MNATNALCFKFLLGMKVDVGIMEILRGVLYILLLVLVLFDGYLMEIN